MKKILLGIGTISMVIGSTLTIVACGTNSISHEKPKSPSIGIDPFGDYKNTGNNPETDYQKNDNSVPMVKVLDNALSHEEVVYNDFVNSIENKTFHIDVLQKALSGSVTMGGLRSLLPSFINPDRSIIKSLRFVATIDRFERASTIVATFIYKDEAKTFTFSIDGFSRQEDFTAITNFLNSKNSNILYNAKLKHQEVSNVNKKALSTEIANALLADDDSLTNKEKELFKNSLNTFLTFKKTSSQATFTIKIGSFSKQFSAPIKIGAVELHSIGSSSDVLHRNQDDTMYVKESTYSVYISNSISLVTIEKGKIIKKDLYGISSNEIDDNSIYYKSDNARYIGTSNGLFELKDGETTFNKISSINFENGFVYKTKTGDLYLGTSEDGLKMIDKDNKQYDISSANVKSGFMFEDKTGKLYLGTNSIGLNSLDENGTLSPIKGKYRYGGSNTTINTKNMAMFETKTHGIVIIGGSGIWVQHQNVFYKISEDSFKKEMTEMEIPGYGNVKTEMIFNVSPLYYSHSNQDSANRQDPLIGEPYYLSLSSPSSFDFDIDDIDYDLEDVYQAKYINKDIYVILQNGKMGYYDFDEGDCYPIDVPEDKNAQIFSDNGSVELFANGVLYKITPTI